MKIKYNDVDIINIISKYEYLKDFRVENPDLYSALSRRINGTGKKFFSHLKKSKRGRQVGKENPNKSKKETLNKNGGQMPATMFPSKTIDGQVYCGRCLKPAINQSLIRKNLCKRCATKCYTLTTSGIDLNPWNIRDQFINTTITHYEKTFHLGLNVDDRLLNYLSLIGYEFIFKDVYDEVK